MRLVAKKFNVSLPFNIGGVTIMVDNTQQRTAWALYIELITRVAIQPLDDERGLLREAFDSLYKIFEITRQILKEAGPEVAQGPHSLGPIAIAVLNQGLAPFLSDWHPKLLDYEALRPDGVSPLEYERKWQEFARVRESLKELQSGMSEYLNALALISGAKRINRYPYDADPESWGLL